MNEKVTFFILVFFFFFSKSFFGYFLVLKWEKVLVQYLTWIYISEKNGRIFEAIFGYMIYF